MKASAAHDQVTLAESVARELHEMMEYTTRGIVRAAQGCLRHDYLVPGGPYEEQWDWDAFFMGGALISQDPTQAIYLKQWALNYLENATPEGKVAGCITPEGFDPRLHSMKPLLAQGVYLSAKVLGDFSWIDEQWEMLRKIVLYRERTMWNEKYDLGMWYDSMESGADNNLAHLDFPHTSVISADVNAFLYKEYRAMAHIAGGLGREGEKQYFGKRAEHIREAVSALLWEEQDGIFYNYDTINETLIRRVSYSSFLPLWAGLASVEQAKKCIENFLLCPEHMKSPHGLRSHSKNDPDYNNVNMIKPHSNWQGPVWPIANYLYAHGLARYGYRDAALDVAITVGQLLIKDINQSGGMHENYDAETGAPLAAPGFISWNITFRNLIPELLKRADPFSID